MHNKQQSTFYYFAYGSNMSPDKLARWDISATCIEIACLKDWCFKMNKRGGDGFARANIEPVSNQTVWGVLYEVDANGIGKLDKMESLGIGYRAEYLPVTTLQQGVYQAYTYIGIKLAEGQPLSVSYTEMILQGSVHHGLPEHYHNWLQAQLVNAVQN